MEYPTESFPPPWCPRIAGHISGSSLSFDPRMGPSTAGLGHRVLSCRIQLMGVFQPLLPGSRTATHSPFLEASLAVEDGHELESYSQT